MANLGRCGSPTGYRVGKRESVRHATTSIDCKSFLNNRLRRYFGFRRWHLAALNTINESALEFPGGLGGVEHFDAC